MASYVIRIMAFIFAVLETAFSLSFEPVTPEAQVLDPAATVLLEARPEVISIIQSKDEIGRYLQEATDIYSSANGGVRFSVRTVSNPSDYRTALRAALLSGEKADLFHIFGYQDMMDVRPYLNDLSGLEWLYGALPGTLDAVSIGESVYGAPYAVEGIGFIINSRIFEKAGIYVGDIVTLEALEELFGKLQEEIDSGRLSEDFPNLEAVTEFAARDKAYISGTFSNIAASGSFASPSSAANASYIDMPGIGEAEEFLKLMALYSSCTKWSQLNDVTRMRQIEDGIASGRVAVILDDTECYRRVYASNPGMEGDLRLLAVPIGNDRTPKKYVYSGSGTYWAVNAGSSPAVRNEAEKFLTWLYNTDSGTALLANRFKAVSPYRGTAKDTGVSLHSQLLRQIELGNSLPMIQNELPRGWGEETLALCVNQYFNHDITWDGLTQKCKEDWHGLRMEY